MTGNKEELQNKIIEPIIGIYSGQLVVENKERWTWQRYKIYSDTIDFVGWKLQIKQNLNLITSLSCI